MASPAGAPWPARAGFGLRGLTIAGADAVDLVASAQTPLLVFDEAEVRDRCRSIRASVPRALYAVKAFTARAMLRLVLDEGLDLLAATGGEVEACLRAGAPPSRIVMHGNAKTDAELELAIGERIGLVIADGLDEMRRLDKVATRHDRVQPVMLRVRPDVSVRTHEAIATGHDAAKFGTPAGDVPAAVAAASLLPGIVVDGLHAHVGSQLLDEAAHLDALDVLLELAMRVHADGLEVRTLDLGGGFGVRYVDERPPSIEELCATLRRHLADGAATRGIGEPALVVEPGRWLVANAGVTLYTVIAAKTVAGPTDTGRRLLAVDGGMSDNVRPTLYDAAYTVASASSPAAGEADEATFTVVGRHCESGDTLAEDVCLPASTGPGDVLAFAATGAYTYSLASTYNRVGRPAVVAIRDGAIVPWLRREDAADLDRLEVGSPVAPERVVGVDDITIRTATPRDASSYLVFWRAVVDEGGHVRTERVTSSARHHRRRFRRPWSEREAQIVAVDDAGDVVGHCYVEREAHPVTRHVATLGIAVRADHRGRGIGTALMGEAVRWARTVGVDKIVLSVYPHNRGAIALYRRFGFVEEGRLARHSRKSYGDEDEILMAAWLPAGAPPADEDGARDEA